VESGAGARRKEAPQTQDLKRLAQRQAWYLMQMHDLMEQALIFELRTLL
jgi:hypothetical protein